MRVSSLYDSAPRDAIGQPRFLDAALELLTDLERADLLRSQRWFAIGVPSRRAVEPPGGC